MTTPPVFPSLDEQDRELAAMCDAAMVQALAEGDIVLADYLLEASAWHADQIEARRSARIWGALDGMAAASGKEAIR